MDVDSSSVNAGGITTANVPQVAIIFRRSSFANNLNKNKKYQVVTRLSDNLWNLSLGKCLHDCADSNGRALSISWNLPTPTLRYVDRER